MRISLGLFHKGRSAKFDLIDKPHGMRRATFDRTMQQIEAAEVICDARLLRFVQKLSWS
jgi:hypothetical protein